MMQFRNVSGSLGFGRMDIFSPPPQFCGRSQWICRSDVDVAAKTGWRETGCGDLPVTTTKPSHLAARQAASQLCLLTAVIILSWFRLLPVMSLGQAFPAGRCSSRRTAIPPPPPPKDRPRVRDEVLFEVLMCGEEGRGASRDTQRHTANLKMLYYMFLKNLNLRYTAS